MSVAVVTDSTCSLPSALASASMTVVPLRVMIGTREGIDGVDITPSEVTKALRDKVKVPPRVG